VLKKINFALSKCICKILEKINYLLKNSHCLNYIDLNVQKCNLIISRTIKNHFKNLRQIIYKILIIQYKLEIVPDHLFEYNLLFYK
jgi:hypothetical protein